MDSAKPKFGVVCRHGEDTHYFGWYDSLERAVSVLLREGKPYNEIDVSINGVTVANHHRRISRIADWLPVHIAELQEKYERLAK